MATIRSVIGKLADQLLGLFGWRGRRLLLVLRDLRYWWPARALGIPLQPWRMQPGFPAGTVTVATTEPPAPSSIQRPIFYGPSQLPLIAGKPIDRMHVLPRRLYRVHDALILPGHIALDQATGKVIPHPILAGESLPHNGLRAWPDGRLSLHSGLPRGTAVTLDEPVFVADTSHQIYGHILLEVLPRLLLLAQCPPETRVLTSLPMHPPYPAMFAAMGVDPSRVLALAGPAFCRTAYLADNFVDLRNFVAPQAWEAFARLAALGHASSIPVAERLYVSRRGIARRPLTNEAEVEALFARHGFTIIRPEALSLEDQVRLFTHARVIAGPGGSAMHNMVFAAPDARVLILAVNGLVLPIDALLTREQGTLGYVLGTSRDPARLYHAAWTIDVARVEQAIGQHLA